MVQNSVGSWLILIGVVAIVIGLLIKTGLLSWFGDLPGDIHIERENFRFYFPLGSMIVISVVLSLVLTLIRRLL